PDHCPHREHGGARHAGLLGDRLSYRLLRGALCPRLDQGAVLSRGDDAVMVELSGQGLCMEADPGQGRHPDVDRQGPASLLAARRHPGVAGGRRAVVVVQLYRHLPGLCIYLDPLHDPAHPGGARARAGQLYRGVGRSLRRAGAAHLVSHIPALGAEPKQTFWTVIFPLALPGIIAGSIFTSSLTLGDYIVPTIVGNSRLMIGQAVYTLQGTAGNVPLAAAFTVVPMVIMGIYLWIAKRMGAFDVL